jgi:hypothetical protein
MEGEIQVRRDAIQMCTEMRFSFDLVCWVMCCSNTDSVEVLVFRELFCLCYVQNLKRNAYKLTYVDIRMLHFVSTSLDFQNFRSLLIFMVASRLLSCVATIL